MQHGRVRDGLVDREQRLLSGQEPVGSHACAGRLVGRERGRRRARDDAGRARLGHRRLDPPAGGALRRRRREAHVRPRVALGPRRVRVEPRSDRAVRARRALRRARARHDRRPRPGRRDQHRHAGRRARGRLRPRSEGPPPRRPRGVFREGPRPRRRGQRPRGHRLARVARLHRDTGPPASHPLRDRDLLRDRDRRVLVEPLALRRRALRPPRRRSEERPGRPLRGDARRRLRRRGEAPDRPRHLRPLGGLLRRLLPPSDAGAHGDPSRVRGRLRRRRRDRRAGLADARVQARRAHRRSARDVPGRRVRRPREPRRPPGDQRPGGARAGVGGVELPVGLQLIGPALAEARHFTHAAAFEAVSPARGRRPPLATAP